MTAHVFARICTSCYTIITEIGPGGRCPVCAFYGMPGWLAEVTEREMIMPFMVVRAMTEPVPPIRVPGGEGGQPSGKAEVAKPTGSSFLTWLMSKMG